MIYEGERPIFQKMGEVSEKEREEREQRNKRSEGKNKSEGYFVFLTAQILKECGNIKFGCRNISALFVMLHVIKL